MLQAKLVKEISEEVVAFAAAYPKISSSKNSRKT